MAHHKSSLKRIALTKKAARNRYYHKTARNAVRALRATTTKKAAEMLPVVSAMLDKLAKNNVTEQNSTSNQPRHPRALIESPWHRN